MKVLAKVLMTAFLIGSLNPLLAKVNNSLETLVAIKEVDEGKIQLAYYGKSPEKLYVKIYNEKDQPVYNEVIKSKSGIKKPYNIKALPYGEYRFEVRVADEIIVHRVKHAAPMYPGNVKMHFKAFGDSKLKMMIMSPDYKKFSLRVYNEQNELLFQQRIDQQHNFGKVLNLKATRAKSVRLVLSDNNKILQRETINL